MEEPLVSILMPVYNREKFVIDAIQSMINQTYQKWELIIVDDHSSDRTLARVKKIIDPRIKIVVKKENEGVSSALNDGLKVAKGDFIGRLDSDDIAQEHRIYKQVKFFQENPDIDICGGAIKLLDSNKIIRYSENHANILCDLILYCPLGSPTVLIRKKVFHEFIFDKELRYAEDYEFWSRVLFHFKSYNIQDELVYYRRHEDQLTNNIFSIKLTDINIKMKLLKKLGYDVKRFPDKTVSRFLLNQPLYSHSDSELYFKWCEHLVVRNTISNVFPKKEFLLAIKVLRSRMIEEIFFRHNPEINKYNRLQALLKITHLEKFTVLKRKMKKLLFN